MHQQNIAPKIYMKDLLSEVKKKLKVELLEQEIKINGLDVGLTTVTVGGGGLRYFFTCKSCQRRCGVVDYLGRCNSC